MLFFLCRLKHFPTISSLKFTPNYLSWPLKVIGRLKLLGKVFWYIFGDLSTKEKRGNFSCQEKIKAGKDRTGKFQVFHCSLNCNLYHFCYNGTICDQLRVFKYLNLILGAIFLLLFLLKNILIKSASVENSHQFNPFLGTCISPSSDVSKDWNCLRKPTHWRLGSNKE